MKRGRPPLPRPPVEYMSDGTVRIPLTRGMWATVDEIDFEAVSQFRWCVSSSYKDSKFYATRRTATGAWEYMHRVIARRALSSLSKQIDHIDGDGLNNRRTNLRSATSSENQSNRTRQRNNTSGYKGVHFDKRHGSWYVKIAARNRQFSVGTFLSAESAARVYDEWAKEAHGKFAVLNFP